MPASKLAAIARDFVGDVQWQLLRRVGPARLDARDGKDETPLALAQMLHEMARGECGDSCLICGRH